MFVFIIKNVRKEKGITLYRLAKLTKLSYSYLSELENNKVFNPSLATMHKISTALNVKINDLFYSKLDINILKEEMYRRINKFGIDSKEVIEISNIIDLLVAMNMN